MKKYNGGGVWGVEGHRKLSKSIEAISWGGVVEDIIKLPMPSNDFEGQWGKKIEKIHRNSSISIGHYKGWGLGTKTSIEIYRYRSMVIKG